MASVTCSSAVTYALLLAAFVITTVSAFAASSSSSGSSVVAVKVCSPGPHPEPFPRCYYNCTTYRVPPNQCFPHLPGDHHPGGVTMKCQHHNGCLPYRIWANHTGDCAGSPADRSGFLPCGLCLIQEDLHLVYDCNDTGSVTIKHECNADCSYCKSATRAIPFNKCAEPSPGTEERVFIKDSPRPCDYINITYFQNSNCSLGEGREGPRTDQQEIGVCNFVPETENYVLSFTCVPPEQQELFPLATPEVMAMVSQHHQRQREGKPSSITSDLL